mgnify:FL=1
MNQQEAAALLAVAAAFDNRKPDADAATAWSAALDGLRFADCRDAVVAHYRKSADWLMPNMVIAEVNRIRQRRLEAAPPLSPPDDLDPDDTMAYTRWWREARMAIADGTYVHTPVATLDEPREWRDVVRELEEREGPTDTYRAARSGLHTTTEEVPQ